MELVRLTIHLLVWLISMMKRLWWWVCPH